MLLRPGRRRAARRRGRLGGAAARRRAGRDLPARRPDPRRGPARRRRRGPPRLRLPVRERRVRGGGDRRRADLDRPAGQGDRRDGLQDRGEGADRRRRRAGAAELDRHRDVTSFPVLVKASAGGGGRGMRVVRDLGELPEAVASARPRGGRAFGDGTVFCERYLDPGRHIEVQVLADTHGTVWALGERECSIQRRHQKIIEEAPSPLVDRRDCASELFEAAGAAGRAVGYAGAGTVEFLLDDGRRVLLPGDEHPAAGRAPGHRVHHRPRPGRAAAAASPTAAAARSTATPPTARARDRGAALRRGPGRRTGSRRPAPCTASRCPASTASSARCRRAGIRLDSGVVDGSVVGVHYDPMLAKVIAWAPTRPRRPALLAAALARAEIHGVATNRDLLVNVLRSPAFLAGDTDTAFFDRHGVFAPLLPPTQVAARPRSPPRWRAAARRRAPRRCCRAPVRLAQRASRPQSLASTAGRPRSRSATGWTGPAGSPTGPAGGVGRDDAERPGSDRHRPTADAHQPWRLSRPPRSGSCSTSTACGAPSAYTGSGSTVFVDGPAGAVEPGRLPRFPLPAAELARRVAARADARLGRPGAVAVGQRVIGRRAAAHAGGDEDGTPMHRPGRRRRRRAPVRPAAGRDRAPCWP